MRIMIVGHVLSPSCYALQLDPQKYSLLPRSMMAWSRSPYQRSRILGLGLYLFLSSLATLKDGGMANPISNRSDRTRWRTRILFTWRSWPNKPSAMKVRDSLGLTWKCGSLIGLLFRDGGEHEERSIGRPRAVGGGAEPALSRLQERHWSTACVVEDRHLDRTEGGIKRQRVSGGFDQGVPSEDRE